MTSTDQPICLAEGRVLRQDHAVQDRVILVTGASGNVGREVVRALRERGLTPRAAERAPRTDAALETVRLDYADPSTFRSATQGAWGLFLMRPPAISKVETTLCPLVDEARRQEVQHIVFLSVAGAEKNTWVPHHAVEQHLMRTSGWTILRPGFFSQNLGDAYRQDILEDNRIYIPAGRGRVAFVDVADLADVTASIFSAPALHDQRAYTLTGGEAIDLDEVASCLSRALSREIRYVPASIVGYAAHLRRRKMPWAQIAVQTILHAGLRLGQAETVDPTLERLLARAPRTLRAYVNENRHIWERRPMG